MEKNIIIKGKHNIEKINKIKDPYTKSFIENPLKEEYYSNKYQLELINKMYLDTNDDFIKKLLITKLNGYKAQDIDKQKLEENKLITLDEVIELLVTSKLKCTYCKENVLLCYKNVREKKQWTLDRINNDFGHNKDNVLISCLDCNLKRRCIDMKKYKQGKLLKNIIKKID